MRKIFKHVPGRKHLIIGNHDKRWVRDLGWHSVNDLVEMKDEECPLVLCHYPLLTWPGIRRKAVHIFGHVHKNFVGFRGLVNVGVDLWDFRPVALSEVLARSFNLESNPVLPLVEPNIKQ